MTFERDVILYVHTSIYHSDSKALCLELRVIKNSAKLFLLYALFQLRIEDRILYRIPNLLNFLNRVMFLPGFLRVLIEPKYKFG